MKAWKIGIALPLIIGCSQDYELTDDTTAVAPYDRGPVAISVPSYQVKRYEQVILDATESYDMDDEEAVLRYDWFLLSGPEDANYIFKDADTAYPSFEADTVGLYEIELVVFDEYGVISENPAGTIVEVVPWENLVIRLDWDTPDMDLDLHLVGPEGEYFGEGDCYFANPQPDWGIEGASFDDPWLSMDDEGTGAGEEITLEQPEDGEYTVYVHFYNRRNSTAPGVSPLLSVWGEEEELVQAYAHELTMPGQVVRLGVIDWVTLALDAENTMTTHSGLGGPAYNEKVY